MNKMKKLGLTALAGSLVAVSAQAGEMSVNGAANVTWAQKDGTEGKTIGTDKGLTVSGSGELDNGWTFYVGTYVSDAITMSTSVTTLTMGSMGTLKAGDYFGGAGAAYDEEVPQAYEQTSDAYQNSSNKVGDTMDDNAIVWDSPDYDLGGATVSLDLAWSPDAENGNTNNGGQQTHTGVYGTGMAAGITISGLVEGLKLGVYAQERENVRDNTTSTDAERNDFQGVWYATYSAGPISVGYSHSYYDSGLTGSATATTTAKTVGTSAGIFEMEAYSIAFNVNDNLSISWTQSDDTYDAQDNASTAVADVEKSTEALQFAYSMGGMSIKAYRMEEDNPSYDSDAKKSGKSEISLGLAF